VLFFFVLSDFCLLDKGKALIVKGKFKQWWSTIPPISIKQTTTTSHFNSFNTKRNTITLDDGIRDHGLVQAQKCDRVKLAFLTVSSTIFWLLFLPKSEIKIIHIISFFFRFYKMIF
jgi:hypothetical protein